MTMEYQMTLEGVIKQRILDEQFDDRKKIIPILFNKNNDDNVGPSTSKNS